MPPSPPSRALCNIRYTLRETETVDDSRPPFVYSSRVASPRGMAATRSCGRFPGFAFRRNLAFGSMYILKAFSFASSSFSSSFLFLLLSSHLLRFYRLAASLILFSSSTISSFLPRASPPRPPLRDGSLPLSPTTTSCSLPPISSLSAVLLLAPPPLFPCGQRPRC